MTDNANVVSLFQRARIVWARRWSVGLIVVVAAAAAYLYSSSQTPSYQASAQVLLTSEPVQSILNGQPVQVLADAAARSAATQAQIAETPVVARHVLAATSGAGSMSLDDFLRNSTATPSADSDFLTLSVTAGSPAQARSLANAYARQYVAYSQVSAVAEIQAVRRRLEARLNSLRNALAGESNSRKVLALQQEFQVLLGKEQDLETLEVAQTGGSRVAEDALKATQVQPRPRRNAALAAVLGLILGIAIALARHAADRRVLDGHEAADALGVPLLARVPRLSVAERKRRGPVLDGESQSPAAEAFRALAFAVDLRAATSASRVIALTSALAGEGKSTCALNLGAALAANGSRVCVVDLDFNRPQLADLAGVAPRFGVGDVLVGAARLEDALERLPRDPSVAAGAGRAGRLSVLATTAALPGQAAMVGTTSLDTVIAQLRREFDLVLVDTPPMVGTSVAVAVARCVDSYIVVCRMGVAQRSDVAELARVLQLMSASVLGVIATASSARRHSDYSQAMPAPARFEAPLATVDTQHANGPAADTLRESRR